MGIASSTWKCSYEDYDNGEGNKRLCCSRDVTASLRKRSYENDGNGEANKKLRCSSELTSKRIKIVVGPSSSTYSVSAVQLCSSSEYFRRIFNSDWWKEKQPTTFPLLGSHPKAFKIYIKWLENGIIDVYHKRSVEGTDAYTEEELYNVSRCYKLAALLEDDDFKDAMIDAMITNLAAEEVVMQDLPRVVYAGSAAHSPHRKFVVECVVNTWGQSCFDEMLQENYPHEFLLDLVIAMGSQIRTGVPLVRSNEFFKDVDTCKYREHTKKNASCYKVRHKISPEVTKTLSGSF